MWSRDKVSTVFTYSAILTGNLGLMDQRFLRKKMTFKLIKKDVIKDHDMRRSI